MSKNIALTLKQYLVRNMSFSINEDFVPGPEQIDLHPLFHKTLTPLDANTASIVLSCRIIKDISRPFYLNVEIEGIFSLDSWKEDKIKSAIMSNNTVAILFPYLRNLITMLTANANVPPYILPVVNINELLKEVEKNAEPIN